jgi:hypothetical protein
MPRFTLEWIRRTCVALLLRVDTGRWNGPTREEWDGKADDAWPQ